MSGGTHLGKFVAPAHSAAPGSPVEGQVYYDTDDDNLFVWTTAGWIDLTQQTPTNYVTTDTIQTITGTKTFSNVVTAPILLGEAGSGATALAARVSGDSSYAAYITTHGHIRLGPGGSTAADVAMKREAAGLLAIRNAADNAYEDLKADNFTAVGTAKTTLTIGTSGAGSGGITFGETINNIYRLGASTVGMDGALQVGGNFNLVGQAIGSDGTAAAPHYSFTNSGGAAGMFYGSSKLQFVAASSQIMLGVTVTGVEAYGDLTVRGNPVSNRAFALAVGG